MLNSIVLMGRMVKDPELKTTANNTEVCSFTLAVEREYGDKKTDFIDCVAWRGNATFISKFFKKGQLIALMGSLQSRQWEDKGGNKRINWEVIVSSVYFTGSQSKSEVKPTTVFYDEPDDSGELPF